MENNIIPDSESINNIQLSKKAIKHISNVSHDKNDKVTWNVDFIFQVEKSIKNGENTYLCSLFDNDSKYNGFIITNPKNENDIPKKGDIIKINRISKFYSEETKNYLYECCNYSFIKKNAEFIENPDELDDITQPKTENACNKNEEIENLKKNLIISQKNNNNKYTLISNIKETDQNFCILVKCVFKTKIRQCNYSNRSSKGIIQQYVFEDINYDKINAIAFGNLAVENDKILNKDCLYEIDKCHIKLENPKYNKTNCPYNIILSENNIITKINKICDNNEKKKFILLSDIINIEENKIINIFCFVLKDYGFIEYKNKYPGRDYFKGHKILLGDVTLNKIELLLWNSNSDIYKNGELLYIQNCKVKDFHGIKSIYSTRNTKILFSYDCKTDKEYTEFYSKNSDLKKFEFLSIKDSIEINRMKQINDIKKEEEKDKDKGIFKQKFDKIIFIKELENIYLNNDEKIYILSAVVEKINYSLSNFYIGCSRCKKKMNGDICEHCNCKNKKIYIHFCVLVKDATGSFWILMFGNLAELFLNVKAEEYKEILCNRYNSNLEDKKNSAIKKINEFNNKILYRRYFFSGRVKKSNYHGKYDFFVSYFRKKQKQENHHLLDYLKSII